MRPTIARSATRYKTVHAFADLAFAPGLYALALWAAYYLCSELYPQQNATRLWLLTLKHSTQFNQPMFVQCAVATGLITAPVMLRALRRKKPLSTAQAVQIAALTLSALCFILGINLPVVQESFLWIFHHHYSLLDTAQGLKAQGEMMLYGFMLLCTIVIPAIKHLLLLWQTFRLLSAMEHSLLSVISKFSLTDVFVVALLVMLAKEPGKATTISLHSAPGIYWFAASSVLTMGLSLWKPAALHKDSIMNAEAFGSRPDAHRQQNPNPS